MINSLAVLRARSVSRLSTWPWSFRQQIISPLPSPASFNGLMIFETFLSYHMWVCLHHLLYNIHFDIQSQNSALKSSSPSPGRALSPPLPVSNSPLPEKSLKQKLLCCPNFPSFPGCFPCISRNLSHLSLFLVQVFAHHCMSNVHCSYSWIQH